MSIFYLVSADNIKQRKGLTLIELASVTMVVGVMASVLLLGIQRIREMSRKLSCTNNLRQIGLALANYESIHNRLPTGCAAPSGASPLLVILPFLEHSELYSQFDFRTPAHLMSTNPASRTRVATFRCPSTLIQDAPRTDYVINRGTTLAIRNDPWHFFEQIYPASSHFSKGASRTALMSEFSPFVKGVRQGNYISLHVRLIETESDSLNLIQECRNADWVLGAIDFGNGQWWWGGGCSNYYHIFPPNYKSCSNGGSSQSSIDTANSMHSGGVNALFGDGHVEFVADHIDSGIWQLQGLR